MMRLLTWLFAGGCACAALAVGLNFVDVRPRPPALADVPALSDAPAHADGAHVAPAPGEGPPTPSAAQEPPPVVEKPPLTPDQEAVLAMADGLSERRMSETRSVVASWKDRFAPHSSFIYEDAEAGRWITLSAARVDCSEVDRVLRRHGDPAIGRSDRCKRWLDKAAQAMQRHGIEDQTPREFLAKLGADMTVRVHLVYASWVRSPDSNEIELLADASVPIYPQADFADREYVARDDMYRHQKLGPYAEDRAVASIQ